nr:unnamed protein product [Spirometra erinaceieuropaei]
MSPEIICSGELETVVAPYGAVQTTGGSVKFSKLKSRRVKGVGLCTSSAGSASGFISTDRLRWPSPERLG